MNKELSDGTADEQSTNDENKPVSPSCIKPNVIGGFVGLSVKVVGKIELNSSESAIDKIIIRKFNHFFERIYGRYGILLYNG